jgi:hypothetical protein
MTPSGLMLVSARLSGRRRKRRRADYRYLLVRCAASIVSAANSANTPSAFRPEIRAIIAEIAADRLDAGAQRHHAPQ